MEERGINLLAFNHSLLQIHFLVRVARLLLHYVSILDVLFFAISINMNKSNKKQISHDLGGRLFLYCAANQFIS